jgi:hypothetical protein
MNGHYFSCQGRTRARVLLGIRPGLGLETFANDWGESGRPLSDVRLPWRIITLANDVGGERQQWERFGNLQSMTG